MKNQHVAIVGAFGAVGTEMIGILEERDFPLSALTLLDVGENVGKTRQFRGKEIIVSESKAEAFRGVDIALFAVGSEISESLAPLAVREGATVIDNSSRWRLSPDVPLVIPEVNGDALKNHRGIIANPNCSTIIALIPIKPLHDFARVKRIIASTYQAASGAGALGIAELLEQTRAVLEGRSPAATVFAHPLAFNLIPHIDSFESNGYTREELKMLDEGRKILSEPELMVNCTCVRVPVLRSHSESITIETERPITPEQAREILNGAPGVRVADNPESRLYPMPINASNRDLIDVGRIRADISGSGNSLTFWCCGDQIRKGAALNAVQIAEALIGSNVPSGAIQGSEDPCR